MFYSYGILAKQPGGAGKIPGLQSMVDRLVQKAVRFEPLGGLDMQQVVPFLINAAPGSPVVKGKAARPKLLPLRGWKWLALASRCPAFP